MEIPSMSISNCFQRGMIIYLVLDALHQSFALGHHIAGHLLSCLGHGAQLELHHLTFLQAVHLVGHAHDAKGVTLALSAT